MSNDTKINKKIKLATKSVHAERFVPMLTALDARDELNSVIKTRVEKACQLLDENIHLYPNDFKRDTEIETLWARFADVDAETLEAADHDFALAGRVVSYRSFGKVTFFHLQDRGGRIQVYAARDDLGVEQYQLFKKTDIGDIVGIRGALFRTKTGELTVMTRQFKLITKSMRPLPDKYHGLKDVETRYRQRYVDLIVTPRTKDIFMARTAVVGELRRFLDEKGFMEVETPMMQAIPGGATAKPFETHHNALDMKLYMRIAPELYLKRLLVGGFEKVYEINRNFRNEGLSTRHNPEFTMLEFYQAYADYRDLMNLTEEMLRGLAEQVLGTPHVSYQGETYDFGARFERLALKEAVLRFNPELVAEDLDVLERAREVARRFQIDVKPGYGTGKIQYELFEKTVEDKLRAPTFITAFPTEVSPLARRHDVDPAITDRFELFVGGREIANGFSELNDAEDQAERFRRQVQEKEAGDEEAMHFDADYIRALEHGMPPTAGEGIGIDRLVMLFTDSGSIRDVLLFPHMRPEG